MVKAMTHLVQMSGGDTIKQGGTSSSFGHVNYLTTNPIVPNDWVKIL